MSRTGTQVGHAILTLIHAILTLIHAILTLIHAILTLIHAILTLIHAVLTATGASGDVLNLFSAKSNGKDFALAMDILRVGYGVSLILSYPVMLFELRHILEKYTVGEDQPYSISRHLMINTSVIGICTFIAIYVESVGTMFGLIGSTTSPAIVFILPAFFYLKLRPDGQMRPLAWLLGCVGVALIPLCLYSWASGLSKH